MNTFHQKLPVILKSLGASFVLEALLLFLAALMIERNLVSMESSALLIVITLVTSSFVICFLLAGKSGQKSDGFIFAVTYFTLLMLMSFLLGKNVHFDSEHIKTTISLFAGTIFGNLLGVRQHYRLRNSSKKRRKATK